MLMFLPTVVLVGCLIVLLIAGLVTTSVLTWRRHRVWSMVAALTAVGMTSVLFMPIETHVVKLDLPPAR